MSTKPRTKKQGKPWTPFNRLVRRVRKIDPHAADWLIKNKESQHSYVTELSGLFTWATSPQGHKYWREIAKKLNDSLFKRRNL